MSLYGTLIFLLLPLNGASRQLVPSDLATRRVTKYELELRKSLRSSSSVRQSRSNWLMSGDKALPTSDEIHECQEGDPPGVSYSGNVNVTSSGRTCQVWSKQEPQDHCYTWLGDHNHCRNPDGSPGGVWCYTIDPEKRYEYCDVPKCDKTISSEGNPKCQEGVPLGASYTGAVNITASGLACKAWTVGDNFCRNPDGWAGGVWCYTTDPDTPWEAREKAEEVILVTMI